MTPRDRLAFAAGIEAARQAALTAAITIETRDDAREVRQQAAVAALQGLAEGLKVAFFDPATVPSPHPTTPCIRPAFSGIDAIYEADVIG